MTCMLSLVKSGDAVLDMVAVLNMRPVFNLVARCCQEYAINVLHVSDEHQLLLAC
jgi:hypothetical protein